MSTSTRFLRDATLPMDARVLSVLGLLLGGLAFAGCAPASDGAPGVASIESALLYTGAEDSASLPTRLGAVLAGQTVSGSFSPTSSFLSWTFQGRAVFDSLRIDVVGRDSRLTPVATLYRATVDGNPVGAALAESEVVQGLFGARIRFVLQRAGRYVVVVRTIDYATAGTVSVTVSLPTVGLVCGTAGAVTCDGGTYCARPACGAPGVCQPFPIPRACPIAEVPSSEDPRACGCDDTTYQTACDAFVFGGGVAHAGVCLPRVGPITATRDSVARPTQIGALLPGRPATASFSPTSRFLAWTFEGMAARDNLELDVAYLRAYHEVGPVLVATLYRATPAGLPTGSAVAVSSPIRSPWSDDLWSARMRLALPQAGRYVVVVRALELATAGTVSVTMSLPTVGLACGTADTVTCDDRTYCARPLGACGAPGVCQPAPARLCDASESDVCGCDGVTYPSACFANASDAGVAFVGDCARDCRTTGCDAGQACTFRPARDVFECAVNDPAGPVCAANRVDPGCPSYPPPGLIPPAGQLGSGRQAV